MARSRGRSFTSIGGKILRLGNLDKVLYPETGFRKADVVRYYRQIAPVMLPHLRGRPVTLKRFPEGVDRGHFFEKRCPSHRPPWFRTIELGDIQYCRADDPASLVWLAQLAAIELHVPLNVPDEPTLAASVVFDLDPGAPAGQRDCAIVALRLRDLLREMKLESFPKTSGMKGLQVYVPLNSSEPCSYEQTKGFARQIAEKLESADRDLIVSRMAKRLRLGKIFIDWSQNDTNKTTVCVYSLRANRAPTVSAPLRWKEVESLAASRVPTAAISYEAHDVLKRVEKDGDLFAEVLSLEQALPVPRRGRSLRYGT